MVPDAPFEVYSGMPARPKIKPADIDPADVAFAVEVLGRVAADWSLLAQVDPETRAALQRLAGLMARPEHRQRKGLAKALRKKQALEKKARDEQLRKDTGIRQLRDAPVFRTPKPALPIAGTDASGWWPEIEGALPRLPAPAVNEAAGGEGEPELHEPRMCYVCKADYTRLHPFYDQMCRPCGDESFARRSATSDLRGRVALITGARVKIGYQAAVMLLRAGCHVVALTRFPRDAAARYAREPDFAAWKDRLSIYGVDLRNTPSVERLCSRLEATLPRLDFQIHNACQTVRRPPGFYSHLVEGEQGAWAALPPAERELVRGDEELREAAVAAMHAGEGPSPALLSQIKSEADLLAPGANPLEIFPRGVLDQDLQQVDLRTHNSWRLELPEVPTLELLEVLLVNATAPFVMAARLKGLMLRDRTPPPSTATSHDPAKHVVMVSAMEGQFYRRGYKTHRHPHTNMAKAALNMMVRTSAAELSRDGIHLNAVDTGWVTDEDPAHLAARKAEEHAFSPPLDIVDGAARIVAPIFEGFSTGLHKHGLFLKDYRPTPW
jgi:NAD(P)-dependent dehydrogenase (short-subunit alcohol dehydrogenase family)